MRLPRLWFLLAICAANARFAQQLGAPPPPAPVPDPFRFQMMGAAAVGRVASITGVPGDPRVW